jgi:hypothetical protein
VGNLRVISGYSNPGINLDFFYMYRYVLFNTSSSMTYRSKERSKTKDKKLFQVANKDSSMIVVSLSSTVPMLVPGIMRKHSSRTVD